MQACIPVWASGDRHAGAAIQDLLIHQLDECCVCFTGGVPDAVHSFCRKLHLDGRRNLRSVATCKIGTGVQ